MNINIVVSAATVEELVALNHPVIVTLANEVKVKLYFVKEQKDQKIQSVLQTPRPTRNKFGQYGSYAEGKFHVDTTIAAVVPNGPTGCMVVYNDGKEQVNVDNANKLSIKYRAQIGMEESKSAKKFDFNACICESVLKAVGFKFRVCTVEGYVFTFVVTKNEGIKKFKYTKY
tara:strand:+ start:329 stop:844 length:516 start_codon:yes stop_codon:yes gene_type:complete